MSNPHNFCFRVRLLVHWNKTRVGFTTGGKYSHDDDKTADAVVVTGTDPLVVVPDEVAATGVDKWIYFQGEKLLNPEYVEPVQQQTQTQTQTQPTATDTGLANISGGFGATGESLADAGLSVADG